tara:strand:+ start:4363 stop:5403 length:1041 start_codon:yes stop_codon:yes gene_type:complete
MGGVEKYIMDLCEHADSDNHDITIVVLTKVYSKSKREQLERKGISVFELGAKNGRDLKIIFKFRSFIKKFKPDIIHFNTLPLLGFVPLCFGSFKTVYTIHQMTDLQIFEKIYKPFLTGVIAVSSTVLSVFKDDKQYFKNSKWTQINNGINLEIRSVSKFDNDVVSLIMVGRITKDKQVIEAIEIIHHLKTFSNKCYKLSIVGKAEKEDHYINEIKEKIIELGLTDSVIFEGWQNDVAPFFEKSQGVLILSERESLCYSGLEALANGVPIFSYKVDGGLHDYHKDGITGIVDSSCNPLNLAKRIHEVFSSQIKWKKYTENFDDVLKDYNVETMAKKTFSFYKSLCAN